MQTANWIAWPMLHATQILCCESVPCGCQHWCCFCPAGMWHASAASSATPVGMRCWLALAAVASSPWPGRRPAGDTVSSRPPRVAFCEAAPHCILCGHLVHTNCCQWPACTPNYCCPPCRLAAYICGYTTVTIVISGNYSLSNFKEDLQKMYKRAGVKGEGLMFLITDSQVSCTL